MFTSKCPATQACRASRMRGTCPSWKHSSSTTMCAVSTGRCEAIWVVVGVCVALLGAAPRFLPVAWVVVAVTFVLTIFGPALGLPDAALDLSPFTHVPEYLIEGLRVAPLVILTAITAALVAAGFVGVRLRDLDQH